MNAPSRSGFRSLRSLQTRLPLVVLAAVAALVPLACGSKPEANTSFSFNTADGGAPPAASNCAPGQPCPQTSCPPGQPCNGAPGPSAAPSQDPNALAGLLAAAAAAGSAWMGPAGAVADPAEAGMRLAAARYAPGMQPDQNVAKGNLAEGGHIDFVVNMDASHCYTIVAFGAGMTDLDVSLLAPPLYNLLAGQDGMAGPTAVVGASPHPVCPIIPLSVPYKVDLYARKGGGLVAAQVYSKTK